MGRPVKIDVRLNDDQKRVVRELEELGLNTSDAVRFCIMYTNLMLNFEGIDESHAAIAEALENVTSSS